MRHGQVRLWSTSRLAGLLAAGAMICGSAVPAVAATPVEERFLIMELMDRYGIVHDLGTPEEYAALFTDDAAINAGNGTTLVKGRDGLIKQAQQDHDRFGKFQGDDGRTSSIMRHVITNRQVELTGRSTAEGSSYVITLIIDRATGPHVFSVSRYLDRYRKVKGKWLIEQRTIIGESGNADLARQFGFR